MSEHPKSQPASALPHTTTTATETVTATATATETETVAETETIAEERKANELNRFI